MTNAYQVEQEVTVIKAYKGNRGTVTVTEYRNVDTGRSQYSVDHNIPGLSSGITTPDRAEAIMEAQFLAGKY